MPGRPAPRPPTEPRGAPRHKVFLPAQMDTPDGSSRVHLLNLSPAGALVHGEVLPRRGATVELSCGAQRWAARVVWAQNRRFGIVHAAPLAPALLDALLATQRS